MPQALQRRAQEAAVACMRGSCDRGCIRACRCPLCCESLLSGHTPSAAATSASQLTHPLQRSHLSSNTQHPRMFRIPSTLSGSTHCSLKSCTNPDPPTDPATHRCSESPARSAAAQGAPRPLGWGRAQAPQARGAPPLPDLQTAFAGSAGSLRQERYPKSTLKCGAGGCSHSQSGTSAPCPLNADTHLLHRPQWPAWSPGRSRRAPATRRWRGACWAAATLPQGCPACCPAWEWAQPNSARRPGRRGPAGGATRRVSLGPAGVRSVCSRALPIAQAVRVQQAGRAAASIIAYCTQKLARRRVRQHRRTNAHLTLTASVLQEAAQPSPLSSRPPRPDCRSLVLLAFRWTWSNDSHSPTAAAHSPQWTWSTDNHSQQQPTHSPRSLPPGCRPSGAGAGP